ncbi:MAG: hypothetical protein HYZ44_00125 [Bacteroidetes bacterium]|nr:hypothetical protein [Bacteroidota bacterium]
MYKGLLDKNKKIVETNLFNLKEAKYRPTGIYDKSILCKQCDTKIIGALESYAAKILFDKKDLVSTVEEDEHIINLIFKGIEYKKFKLFLISILWRASISKQRMFDEVKLGAKYEEVARKMIYEDNPGKRDEFSTCIFGLKSTENLVTQTIVAPRRTKVDGNTSYMFYINGLFYWFNISAYNMQDVFKRITIDESNEMTIGILKGKVGEDFLDSFLGRKLRLSKKF